MKIAQNEFNQVMWCIDSHDKILYHLYSSILNNQNKISMPKEDRLQAIKELQECRNSKVIIYFLGDRVPVQIFATQIAIDVIQLLIQIFKEEGKSKKVTLVLHSNGGNLDTPWPLVNLIRGYTNYLEK